jgi:two-component sensor histidine kinase
MPRSISWCKVCSAFYWKNCIIDVFRWAEIGGPPVQIPARQSFGTLLIEQDFVGELRGEAHLSFEPSGVVCKLDIPLAMLIPAKPTEDG